MNDGRLVLITGIDGSGKRSVLSELEDMGYEVSHWRRLSGINLKQSLDFINPASYVQTLDGVRRLDFIKGYIKAEWDSLIEPYLVSGKNIVADSFFIKFFAKEQIYKRLVIDDLLKLSPLKGNELVIFIDTPPRIAHQRKKGQTVSEYEYKSSPQDFENFQARLRDNILKFTDTYERTIINGCVDKGAILRKVLQILEYNNILPNQ